MRMLQQNSAAKSAPAQTTRVFGGPQMLAVQVDDKSLVLFEVIVLALTSA